MLWHHGRVAARVDSYLTETRGRHGISKIVELISVNVSFDVYLSVLAVDGLDTLLLPDHLFLALMRRRIHLEGECLDDEHAVG